MLRSVPFLFALFLLLVAPSAQAYSFEVTSLPGKLPVLDAQTYTDPYPGGEVVELTVTFGCDEVDTEMAVGGDVWFQLRREVDWRIGLWYGPDTEDGYFAIDASECLSTPGHVFTQPVKGYLAASSLVYAFSPQDVLMGVYPVRGQGDPDPSDDGREAPSPINFTVEAQYVGEVFPLLAGTHGEDGMLTMDVLLQTSANADTVFDMTVTKGPDGLVLPAAQVNVTDGENARLVTLQYPLPGDHTEASVYNWTIDIVGHAVLDGSQQIQNASLQFEVQPGFVAPAPPRPGAPATGDEGQATSAPFGALVVATMAVWMRRRTT